jgi:hypothetical protein
MNDSELLAEELKLDWIAAAERDAEKLLAKLQSIPSSRHLTIAIAGIENATFRIREERRITAGRVMKANQAAPENLP